VADEEVRVQGQQGGAVASVIPAVPCGAMAQELAGKFSIHGGSYSFSTACTSSANAICYAMRAVNCGRIPAAVVVGIECFNRTTLYGFEGMNLLSVDALRPFDRERSGLVLGEGVAALVVTSDAHCGEQAGWRNVSLRGGATGCDPYGFTCSSPESMATVMHEALAEAQLGADEVVLVKAHATGSESNDEAEAKAMRSVFATGMPHVTALKGALGHTLGACGVVETVALLSCLRRGRIPTATGFSAADPQLGVSLLTDTAHFSGGSVMMNHFGFGGNNCSFLLEVVHP
jgi:3-oxoacyl-[acyl-carrier-protein] synthase-1